MPNFKKIRIQHKGETEANWLQSSLIPLENEIIIYEPDDTYSYSRIKIGDGVTNVNDLPFITKGLDEALKEEKTIAVIKEWGDDD